MQAIQREAIAPSGDPLTHADKQIIAGVLSWDCQRDVAPEEIEALAIVHDIVWVKLTINRAVPLHVETFRSIRRSQMEANNAVEQIIEQDDVEYVTQLEAALDIECRGKEDSARRTLADATEQIEVDSTNPGIHRIWKGKKLIGTVRRCEHTFCWLASSTMLSETEPYLTAKLAISAVDRAWSV